MRSFVWTRHQRVTHYKHVDGHAAIALPRVKNPTKENTAGGRVFHVCGPEAEKARLPELICVHLTTAALWLTTTSADVAVTLPC